MGIFSKFIYFISGLFFISYAAFAIPPNAMHPNSIIHVYKKGNSLELKCDFDEMINKAKCVVIAKKNGKNEKKLTMRFANEKYQLGQKFFVFGSAYESNLTIKFVTDCDENDANNYPDTVLLECMIVMEQVSSKEMKWAGLEIWAYYLDRTVNDFIKKP